MIAVQSFKGEELREGYTHDDPFFYQRGPKFWEWTIETWFGSMEFIACLVVSVLIGCFNTETREENINLATWSLPFLIYALFFVAPKPDHYIFPSLIPLYIAALDIPSIFMSRWKKMNTLSKVLAVLCIVGIAVLLVQQFAFSFSTDIKYYQKFLIQNM